MVLIKNFGEVWSCFESYKLHNMYVLVVIANWVKMWAGRTIKLCSNNMAVVHALNNMPANDIYFWDHLCAFFFFFFFFFFFLPSEGRQ